MFCTDVCLGILLFCYLTVQCFNHSFLLLNCHFYSGWLIFDMLFYSFFKPLVDLMLSCIFYCDANLQVRSEFLHV